MPVTIEPAGHADLEPLLALLQQLFAIEADFSFTPARARRGLEQLLADERACILLARNTTGVIGMCSAQLVCSTAEGAFSAWVEDVVVDSACRGQGIGRRLIEEIAAWARGQGATRLQLLADRENATALEFYRRLGWRKTQLVALRLE